MRSEFPRLASWRGLAVVLLFGSYLGPTELSASDPIIIQPIPGYNNYPWMPGEPYPFPRPGETIIIAVTPVTTPILTGTALSTKLTSNGRNLALTLVQEKFADTPKLIAEQFPKTGAKESSRRELTRNQQAVAEALDDLVVRGRGGKLIDFLNQRLLPNLPSDFDSIAPEELTSVYHIATSLADTQRVNLQRRTDSLRSGSTGFTATGFAINGSGPGYNGYLSPVAAGQEGKESKSIVARDANPRWGAFLSGTGDWIDVDGDHNAIGYDIETGGITLGLDYRLSPTFAVGLSAGYAGTGAELDHGGRIRVNGGQLGIYATYFAGGFYTDLSARGGYNSYDTKRAGIEGTARGSAEGGEFNAFFGAGYDFQIGKLQFGPTASVQYTYVGLEGFEEHGSLAPLAYPDQSEQSLKTTLGIKASYECQIGRVTVRPEARAAWQHEFGDDRFAFDASLPNAAGSVFTVEGPRIGRDALLVGAGVTVQCNERMAIYVSYDAQLLRENYESHAVSAGLRLAF